MNKFVCHLMEKFYIPDALISNTSKKMLHLTDTPSQLYPEIDRLLTLLRPELVIHTGDLSDEIKLERSPSKIDLYRIKMNKLNKILLKHPSTQFVFVSGNHDDFHVLTEIISTVRLYKKNGVLNTRWGKLAFAHKFDDLPTEESDYYLYGHSDDRLHLHMTQSKYLNGLLQVYVITESPICVHKIKYPPSTDSIRQRKLKAGF